MKKNKILISILSIVVLVLIVGVSYAYFGYYKKGTYELSFEGGKLDVLFTSLTGSNVTLQGMYPMTDDDGIENGLSYSFNITGYNESNKDIHYRIYMEDATEVEEKTRFNDSDIRIAIYRDGVEVLKPSTIEDFYNPGVYFDVIKRGTSIDSPISYNYEIKVWIGEHVRITDTVCDDEYVCYSQDDFKNLYFSKNVKVEADFSYDDLGYLTYNANGSETLLDKTSVSTQTITNKKPVKEGMGFLGWSSDPLAEEAEYYAGDTYTGTGKTLYAIYSETKNVMNTFPSNITNQKAYITSVSFINDKLENLEVRYNAVSIKSELTYNSQGKVLGWLENDYYDETNSKQYYKLYIGSEGTIYLNTGYFLFNLWSSLTNIDFTNVDTCDITDMSCMFRGCNSLTALDLSNFNTSKVTRMSSMFAHYMDSKLDKLVSLDISSFDTSNVTSMCGMFCNLSGLTTLDLSHFDTSNVTDMGSMFYNCNSLSDLKISKFDTSSVTDMSSMFFWCCGLTELNLDNFDTSNVSFMNFMFTSCNGLNNINVSSFDTSNVEYMTNMFYGCIKIKDLDVSRFNTINVIDMASMFQSCKGLTKLNLSNFDTSNVITMSSMFEECVNLNFINLTTFDTSNVTTFSMMFRNCSSLKMLDLNHFDTSNVTNMKYMFYGCSSLETVKLDSFDTSSVTNMSSMFEGCSSLETVKLDSFDTSSVTNMSSMFRGCSSLETVKLDSFDTSSVTNMSFMFDYCYKLEKIDISGFSFDAVTDNEYIFRYVGKNLEDGIYTTVVVNSAIEQTWILNLGTNAKPSGWSVNNVVLKSV